MSQFKRFLEKLQEWLIVVVDFILSILITRERPHPMEGTTQFRSLPYFDCGDTEQYAYINERQFESSIKNWRYLTAEEYIRRRPTHVQMSGGIPDSHLFYYHNIEKEVECHVSPQMTAYLEEIKQILVQQGLVVWDSNQLWDAPFEAEKGDIVTVAPVISFHSWIGMKTVVVSWRCV